MNDVFDRKIEVGDFVVFASTYTNDPLRVGIYVSEKYDRFLVANRLLGSGWGYSKRAKRLDRGYRVVKTTEIPGEIKDTLNEMRLKRKVGLDQ